MAPGAIPTTKAASKTPNTHTTKSTSATALAQKVENNRLHRQLQALSQNGRPYPLKKYKSLSWPERRTFADKLKLDPEVSWLSLEENEYLTSEVTISTTGGGQEGLYVWDIAALNGLVYNPRDKVTSSILKGILEGVPSEESENAQHRKNGFRKFFYTKTLLKEDNVRGKQLNADKKVRCTAEEQGSAIAAFDGVFKEHSITGDEDCVPKRKRRRGTDVQAAQTPSSTTDSATVAAEPLGFDGSVPFMNWITTMEDQTLVAMKLSKLVTTTRMTH